MLTKGFFARVGLLVTCLGLTIPAAAEVQSVPGVPGFAHRQKCLEVGCAPKRDTFGYYPTTWRRWPTEELVSTPTPTPAAEQLPPPTATPAEQPPPMKIEPDQPAATPEAPGERTLVPTEPEPALPEGAPTTPEPKLQPDTMLPFEDRPPSPPPDSPSEPGLPGLPAAPSEPAPDTVPGAQPPAQVPPSQDAPPTMPDDDPFKDDPPVPGPEPQTPAAKATDKQTSCNKPASEAMQNAALHWRVVAQEAVGQVDEGPINRVPAGEEPALVTPPAAPATNLSGTLSAVTPALRNPLRLAAASTPDAQVIPTASWTGHRRRSPAAPAADRRNPLRDN
jgi:hypothetical protein